MKFTKFRSVVFVDTPLTAEILKKVSQLNPAALVLRDADKNELYRAQLGTEPTVNARGIVIHEKGKRDLKIEFDKPVTDAMVQDWAAPFYGKASALEVQILAAAAEIDTQVGAIEITEVEEA